MREEQEEAKVVERSENTKKKNIVLVLRIVSFGLMALASVVSRCQGSQSTICLRPRDKQEASEIRTATETETAARVFFSEAMKAGRKRQTSHLRCNRC